ncbi:ATP synthase F1 subunit gamma [Clostridium paraputrificum]|uniref:ATP synthase F1 subunit gamma n=1 Tax=Clostridium TaxID=1485 RepID=UPI003D32F1D7
MGAAGLIEIKRRLKSVQSTKKITNAMGLVATSKLRKCRKELATNNKYVEVAEKTMKSLATIAEEKLEIPYFNGNNSDRKLYIVMTSDSGLCAGYNNNVVSYLGALVKDHRDKVSIITVGSKGLSYIKRAGLETIAEYVDIPDVPTIKEVKVIYEKALKLFNEEKVSEVHIVYTEFHSPVKQEVKSEMILPVQRVEGEVGEQLVEPDIETVLKDSLDIYLKGKIRNLMLSAKCSEQSSRMTAMDGATNNANDIISALNIKYNRIRQSMITQEISEIVGGAEAQK